MSAGDATSLRAAEVTAAAPGTSARVRLVSLAAMVAGPLLVGLADVISPIDTSRNTVAERLAIILDQTGAYSLAAASLLFGMMLLVPATVAASRLVTGRGRGAAFTGTAIATTGFILFCVNIGAVGIGPTAWASLPDAQQAALVPAFTAMDNGEGLMPVPISGAMLPLVGLITLAVGLWRGRAAPRWATVALPLGWAVFLFGPLHIVRTIGALIMLAAFLPMIARLRTHPS